MELLPEEIDEIEKVISKVNSETRKDYSASLYLTARETAEQNSENPQRLEAVITAVRAKGQNILDRAEKFKNTSGREVAPERGEKRHNARFTKRPDEY